MTEFFVTLILTFVMTVGMFSLAFMLATLFPAPQQKAAITVAIVMGVCAGAAFIMWVALEVKP